MLKRNMPFSLLRVFSCFKRDKEKENLKCTRNTLLEWHTKRMSFKQSKEFDNATEPIPLATWPGQQLYNTVKSTIAQENISFDLVHVSNIERQIEIELQELCPFERKEQYDFCIISSESDSHEAEELTNDLNERFDLAGHLVWNSVYLGADQFTVFEDVIERSSVVIFYITKKFIEDEFCCHIARNKLVSPIEMCGTIRDIPLLIDPDVILPESFRLVQKLTLQYVGSQFPKIFTEEVRLEKVERQVQCEILTDSMRLSLLREAVKRVCAR